MKSHHLLDDMALLAHAIACAGDEWRLAKALDRNWKTISMWPARKKLPQGARGHILLLLDHVLTCDCPTVEAKSDQKWEGRRKSVSGKG